MYNKILVALDGSELSETILPYARAFAQALKIPAELLHVIDPETLMPSVIAHQGRYDDLMTAERKHGDEYLKRLASSFASAASVGCSLEIGRPAEVIVDRAAAQAGTLITMTTHGYSGLKRWLLGSVAEKVLEAAKSDLLVVRAAAEGRKAQGVSLKRVIVPLDGSELAEIAIPHAVELAKAMALEIILARAFSLPPLAYNPEGYTPNLEELWSQLGKEAEEYLDARLRQIKGQGLEKVSALSAQGPAADKIIEVARQKPESLIAMSTHGRSGVGRWVLGSVAERVVRYSDDPVLIVRAASAQIAA